MLPFLIGIILIRPFISGIAYPYADLAFTALTIAVLLLALINKKPDPSRFNSVVYPSAVFIAGIGFSLVSSADIAASTIELFKFIPCILVLLVAASLNGQERKTVLFAIMCSAVVICGTAIYQRLFGFGRLAGYMADTQTAGPVALNYLLAKRVFFPFVTPNALAGYCAMALPLCLCEKRFYWIAAPLTVVLLLAQSLGALLGLALGIYLCMLILSRKTAAWQISLVSGALALFAVIFLLRIFGKSLDTAAPGLLRLEYWRNALTVIQAHWLFGAGIGNMHLRSSMHAHNIFLQIWAETGVLGLGGFIWLCAAVLRAGARTYSEKKDLPAALLICSCLVFLFHNLFDFTFFLPEASFLWWLLMGLLL